MKQPKWFVVSSHIKKVNGLVKWTEAVLEIVV